MTVTISHNDWKQAAADELRGQLDTCVQTIKDCDDQARILEERRDHASERAAEIKAAARTLGIDLMPFELTPTEEAPISPAVQGSSPSAADIILEALSETYPKPLRSADFRRIIQERIGRAVHEKTPGMSLYRLSKAGKVRREGVDWFLQPKREALIDEMLK